MPPSFIPYKNKEVDCKSVVIAPETVACLRCGERVLREPIPAEWALRASGKCIVSDKKYYD